MDRRFQRPRAQLGSNNVLYQHVREELIRLLEIVPGSGDEPLVCNLIKRTQHFEALSYTWGPSTFREESTAEEPRPRATITCNDSPAYVTPSLETALRHLRYPDIRRVLWVDAICVNQSDLDERRIAVIMMNKIYHQARFVVIWLGEESCNSDIIMERIATITPEPYVEGFNAWYLAQGQNTDQPQRVDASILHNMIPQYADAIDDFLSRPWFRRVWVQQEAAPCQDIVVHCGQKEASWIQVFSFAWMVHVSLATDLPGLVLREESRNAIQLIMTMQKNRLSRSLSPDKPKLLEVLQDCKSCGASVPMDKLYALLHLGRDQDLARLAPYSELCRQTGPCFQ